MNRFTNKTKGIAFTLIMCALLLTTIIGVIAYMYQHSENEAFERLRLETAKQKKSISLQLTSDRETLTSMASLIGMNYSDNAGYLEVCKSFEAFGLCDEIGILVPGDILITKHGESDVKGLLSYEDEKKKGSYISGPITDVTNDKIAIIRSAVPIVDGDDNVKAILFGTISSENFSNYYKQQTSMNQFYLCIIDGENGHFVIDTKDVLISKSITRLSHIDYKNGFNYGDLYSDISKGNPGYTSFLSNDNSDFLYVYYDTLNIENWRIMLAQPSSIVLKSTHSTVSFLVISSSIICLIVLVYILVIAYSNRKKSRLNYIASEIRKNLLEINNRNESLVDALRILTEYAKSRSAFVIDSYDEGSYYIRPEIISDRLNEEEIEYFNGKLLYHTSITRKANGISLYNSEISADLSSKNKMPELYDFMVKHNIERVIYNVILNENGNTYILGVLNPKNKDIGHLLNEISACFSMALYNRKHLEKTHKMAFVDSLTGVKNRMAWSVDKKKNIYQNSNYICVYIDVNELNYFNNKHGHSAGDRMLKYIGEVLRNHFYDSNIYRMGGDEFLILNKTVSESEINKRLTKAVNDIEGQHYRIAFGVQHSSNAMTLEESVNAAEKLMYQNKALYYQEKDLHKIKNIENKDVKKITTGIKELDACLSVMSIRYFGVYFVSLDSDTFVRILAPKYFEDVDESNLLFSQTMKRYISEFIKPKYHRSFLSFLEYDVLKKEFADHKIPEISYVRIDGAKVTLKIYLVDCDSNHSDCIWVFEKSEEIPPLN